MTADELAELASAAWGEHWRHHLATALACSREIVWRWEHGHNPIPDKRARDIRKVCAHHMRERIREIQRQLHRAELAA